MANAPKVLGRRLTEPTVKIRQVPLIVTGTIGLVLLIAYASLELSNEKPPRLSGLMLEVGAGLLLFAVLLAVQVRIIERVVSEARAVTAEEFAQRIEHDGGNPLTPGDFYADGGPFEVASRALGLFARGELREVWPMCDQNWRRCRAMAWLYNNRSQLGLADELTVETEALVAALTDLQDLPHGLTDHFIASETDQYSEALSVFDEDRWGWSQRRRLVGPLHEIVLALPLPIDAPHGLIVDEPTIIVDGIKVLLSCDSSRQSRTYLVAGIWQDAAPLPTWPPTWWVIDDPVAVASHPGAN